MRENTYIKIETLMKVIYKRCAMDIIGFQVNNVRSRLIINVSK